MRKWVKVWFLLVICVCILYNRDNALALSAPIANSANGPVVNASAYILVEPESGRVLLGENIHTSLPIASTTKVLTALVVLNHCRLDEIVEIPPEASGVEGSSMYLEAGERLTVEQLLLGLFIRSGNDAATALAIHAAGTVEEFVRLMNQTALDIGCTSSHFQNPHGLPDERHFSSAADLAKIASAAYRNADFRRLCSTQYAQIPWEGHPWMRVLKTKNRILTEFPGGTGMKTGYTKEAGHCLVASAERDGMKLISVVLNGSDYWNQSKALLEYGFQEYTMRTVVAPGTVVAHVKSGPFSLRVCAEGITLPLKQGEACIINTSIPSQTYLPLGSAIGAITASVGDFSISCHAYSIDPPQPALPDSLLRIFTLWPLTA